MARVKRKRGPKRNAVEIARDRALVAELHLKGLTFVMIANELNNRPGIGYSIVAETVSRDYHWNIEYWNKQSSEPTGADIEQQKARLRIIEVEAWAAWERSKDPAKTIRQIKKMKDIFHEETGEVIDQILATETVEELIKSRVGDERFLRIILDAWDKRARLDGQYVHRIQLDANIKEEKEITFKMYEGVSPSMWDNPAIKVIDGQITRNGKPMQIIDGQAMLKDGKDGKDGEGKDRKP